MPTPTPYQGIPVPVATDPDNVPVDLSTITRALEQRSVMRFANAAARSAAIASPVDGMPSYRQDADRLELFNGSTWEVPRGVVAVYSSDTDRATRNPSPQAGDQAWMADSRQHLEYNGVRWLPAGVQLYGEATAATTVSTLGLSNIPQHAKHLRVILVGQSLQGVTTSNVTMTINNITASYNGHRRTQANGAVADGIFFASASSAVVGDLPGTSYSAQRLGFVVVEFPLYSNTSWIKAWYTHSYASDGGGNASSHMAFGSVASSTAGITRVDFTCPTGFNAGTYIACYGEG